jgi:hypothetical protein
MLISDKPSFFIVLNKSGILKRVMTCGRVGSWQKVCLCYCSKDLRELLLISLKVKVMVFFQDLLCLMR